MYYMLSMCSDTNNDYHQIVTISFLPPNPHNRPIISDVESLRQAGQGQNLEKLERPGEN